MGSGVGKLNAVDLATMMDRYIKSNDVDNRISLYVHYFRTNYTSFPYLREDGVNHFIEALILNCKNDDRKEEWEVFNLIQEVMEII